MTTPTASVVMPVYNGENYLRLAVESVLSQTFQDFEIIVIDDGSKDATPDMAQSFGDRVRYTWQGNGEVAAAVNHGISLDLDEEERSGMRSKLAFARRRPDLRAILLGEPVSLRLTRSCASGRASIRLDFMM